jgi:hypothetical protein
MVVAVDCANAAQAEARPAAITDAYNPERNIEASSLAYVASARCGLLTEFVRRRSLGLKLAGLPQCGQ